MKLVKITLMLSIEGWSIRENIIEVTPKTKMYVYQTSGKEKRIPRTDVGKIKETNLLDKAERVSRTCVCEPERVADKVKAMEVEIKGRYAKIINTVRAVQEVMNTFRYTPIK